MSFEKFIDDPTTTLVAGPRGPSGEQVELLIDNKLFAFWDDLELKLSLDSFDTVGFSAPFEPENDAFRETFARFSYKPVKVFLGGDPIFTGTMIDVDPEVNANSGKVNVTCYSQPGVLCDCTAPTGFGRKGRRADGAILLEFHKASIVDIARQLCEPFGLQVECKTYPGPPFEQAAIKIEEKIHGFLCELAKQRGLVLTNSGTGALQFLRPIAGGGTALPVVQFVEGVPPLTGVKAKFSPQDYFSEITGFAPARHRKPGSRYTVLNPWLGANLDKDGGDPINTFRPMSCRFDDTERGDAPDATKAKVGRMFGNMVSYETAELPTWRDPDGKLWNPNTILTLLAPHAMVYKETELLIRTVTLRQNKDKESAVLEMVLPGAFSGQVPDTLPWRNDRPEFAV